VSLRSGGDRPVDATLPPPAPRPFQRLRWRQKPPALRMETLHHAPVRSLSDPGEGPLPPGHEPVPQKELLEGTAPRQPHGEGTFGIEGSGEAPRKVLRQTFVPGSEIKGIGKEPETMEGFLPAEAGGVCEPSVHRVLNQDLRVPPGRGLFRVHLFERPGKRLQGVHGPPGPVEHVAAEGRAPPG
jgi:hypothetical protein